jgi:capsular polysaccharide transport system permease protein
MHLADTLNTPASIQKRTSDRPVRGNEAPAGGLTDRAAFGARQFFDWLAKNMTFWTVVPIVGLVGFVYLYAYTDSLYQSSAIVDLQNASSTSASSSLGSLVGSSLFGSTGSTTQSGAVVAYIQSPDILKILDKKFHLRKLYASAKHSPFWRLDQDASDEDFLTFYQQMVTVAQDSTTLLITINVLDYDADEAREICKAVITASQKSVNDMSAVMSNATLKYAKDQLTVATKAVETAQPYERSVAEMELTAAQQALVSAEGLANQQQSFLVTVNAPNMPTDTTNPDRLVDEAIILLATSLLYMIAHLLLANVRDHRRA